MASGKRMAPMDITWLRMDRPTNHMVVIGVIILREPVDLDRVARTLAARLLTHDRFRQRIEKRATGFWWTNDPRFDIDHHIRRTRLPGAAGKAELQRFVAELAARPFDQAHPLWQTHIVESYEEGCAVVMRTHHAIGDGAALMRVLLDLTDETPDAPLEGVAQADGDAERDDPYSPPWEMLAPLIEAAERGVSASAHIAKAALAMTHQQTKVLKLLNSGFNVALELAYLLFMPMDSPTRLKGILSGDKRAAWSHPIALTEVKAVGHALGCTVNDLLLASFAGAISAYLAAQGDDTHGLEVRALVPINLRPPGPARELGNKFGIIAVELPVGIADPLARLKEVHRRMESLKHSYEPVTTLGLIDALGYGPKWFQDQLFDLLLSRATAVMSNVPGPQGPLYLGGSPIDQIMFWVPQSGEIGMGVSLFTFNDRAQLGLITDAAVTPHPDEIIKHFRPAFEQLLYHALLNEGHKHDEQGGSKAAAPIAKPKRARKPAAKRAAPKREKPAGAKPRRHRTRGDVATAG